MRKNKVLKIAIIAMTFVILFNTFSTDIYAMTSSYAGDSVQAESSGNVNNMLSTITGLVLPVVYPLFNALVSFTQNIMHSLTGSYFFPWSDSIIFNRIAILDVNFINPEPGSLFMDSSGNYTTIGNVVRNVYFTILSICIGFLGIAVAINVIKMLMSSMASSKARAKEMINATVVSLVLLFGMHYVISFVFYINEQLVQVASDMAENLLNGDTIKDATNNLYAAEDADNEQLVTNFYDKLKYTSIWSPITILKKAGKEIVNLVANVVSAVADKLKSIWKSLFGDNSGDSADQTTDISVDDKKDTGYYDEIFPSKEDFFNYLHDETKVGPHGVDIAAYLIKDYIFRDLALDTVAGNDTNRFVQSGGWGLLQSGANTLLWFTGIVDTGLIGVQNLYQYTFYIYNELNDTVKAELGYELSSATLCKKAIEYYTVIENAAEDDDVKKVYHLKAYFVKAYYRYVYEGDDKDELEETTSVIQSLGDYFSRNVYYTDLDSGAWSPTTFDAIMCVLYCVFVLQSFMFLFSYIRRLLYVVVLAVLGPVTVIFDYVSKSY